MKTANIQNARFNTRKQKGFSMLELVFVLLVIAGLMALFLPDLITQRQDAKYSSAITQIEKNFTSAIGRQVGRTGSCTTTNVTKTTLVNRGLPSTTIYGTEWTVTGVANNVVTIAYPIDSNDSSDATNMVSKLTGNANFSTVSAAGSTVTIGFRCS